MAQFFRAMFATVCLMFLGGCGFSHQVKLRAVYDRIELGKPFATDQGLPSNTATAKHGRAWGAMLWNKWEWETGANEWIIFVENDSGEVIGKRYQVRGEEYVHLAGEYHRIDRSEWAIVAPKRSDVGIDTIRGACRELSLDAVGLPRSFGWDDLRFVPVNPSMDIEPADLLQAAEKEGVFAINGPRHFNRVVSGRPEWGLQRRTRWALRLRDEGQVKIVVEDEAHLPVVFLMFMYPA